VTLADEVEQAKVIQELKGANARLSRALARKTDKTADLIEAVYQAAKDSALVVGRPGIIPPPPRDRRRSPEAALLHLTDWQLGKVTETYSVEVCQERVRTAVQKTIKLTEIQRADHPVRECHVMLGGDLVEGITIFPGNHWEIEASMFEQVFTAAALVEQVVSTLLGAFERVTVWEVSGNHGRLGRKGDAPRGDNWDRVVGKVARDNLAGNDRLTWHEPEGWYQVVVIGEYRALLVHGDQVKSFGGNVPAYGVLRKANAWQAGAIPEKFGDVYLGHMHQPMALQMSGGHMAYMTPSTESSSAYAREFMGALGRPGQRLHFIDPRRGRETASYLLWLDD
jgi:hypothetical protein